MKRRQELKAILTDAILAHALFVFVILTMLPYAAKAATPPINCKKASSPVEKTICNSPEFVAMDREIAALYDRGLAEFTGDPRHELAQGQLAFIKQRSGCGWAAHHSAHPGPAVNECIRDKMEIRLHSLRNSVERAGR